MRRRTSPSAGGGPSDGSQRTPSSLIEHGQVVAAIRVRDRGGGRPGRDRDRPLSPRPEQEHLSPATRTAAVAIAQAIQGRRAGAVALRDAGARDA